MKNTLLKKLFVASVKSKEMSYSPYSKFRVGSAILTINQKIISGCNVENAVNGESACAEKNVIAQAIAQGENQFDVLIVATDSENFIFPCGSCRQTIMEFSPDCVVYALNKNNEWQKASIQELLPNSFSHKELKK